MRPRIAPSQGLLFVESVRERFSIVALSEREYLGAIAAAERGIAGGKIYGALILRCAPKAKVETIHTWNLQDFRQLADAEIAARIRIS